MFIPGWDPSGRTRHFICILKTEGDFSSGSSAERRDFADTKSNAERQGSGEAGRVPGRPQAGLRRACWGGAGRGRHAGWGRPLRTHTHPHVHRHAQTHARTHAHKRAHTHPCAPTHAFTHVHRHAHRHTHACSQVCTHTHVLPHMHSHVCTGTRTDTRTHAHKRAHTHTHVLPHMHSHMCTGTQTHARMLTSVHTHTHVLPHMHSHMCKARAQTHTRTHAHKRAHTHSRALSPLHSRAFTLACVLSVPCTSALTVTRTPSCCGGRPPSRAARLAAPGQHPRA